MKCCALSVLKPVITLDLCAPLQFVAAHSNLCVMNMHHSDSLACGAGVLRFLLGCEHQERGSLATPSTPDSTAQHGLTNMS